ncbi:MULTISPECIES: serine hydrolase [unclassified Sphingopyxis]|uniref:serine hydrolase n=1 Tax=unclassified Sphingopyxis TaxID=2614943 RepID=UPI00286133D2|nr:MULTISPECIES: serine hydrolase [unclassified Sphingopyxis]MDR6831940.1 beta-lactamase class A [Sphingopyxis sp. BE122]MDR7227682.1 beta-lactamase class A [Sphingopyxis sp. BE259]
MKTLFASLLTAAMILPASAALAQQTPEATAAADTAFDRRAAQLVDLLAGRIAFADYFDPSFQAAVPEAQFKTITTSLVAQYGTPVTIDSATSTDGKSGTVRVRFEKGIGTIGLEVGSAADQRIAGLRILGFEIADDSFPKVAAELAALPGDTGFLVAELDGNAMKPLVAANPDRQFAVGSTFKLYILDELAAQVAEKKRRWSDVVPLSHLSFSSMGTANWPKDTPVTLQSLANWMISVSDNSATDTLIHLLGREAIEARMRAAGHSDPSRNIPFLTTVEAFALKGNNFANERTAFVAGDDAAQRKLLAANRDRLTLANVDGVSFAGGPRFIDSLEWFASPNDVARAMIDLRNRQSPTAMSVMAINPGVNPGATKDWSWLGYKGGSELGVISMSLLGERKSDGKWFVVTASWNNPKAPVATETLVGLVTRLLALAAK